MGVVDCGGLFSGARVDVCGDPQCATTLITFDVDGTEGASTEALPEGLVYWRVHSLPELDGRSSRSPIWPLWVGDLVENSGTAWGSRLDVNRDGAPDMIVGACAFGEGGSGCAKRALVYHGSANGFPLAANTVIDAPQGGDQFGFAVGNAGDVNGDGFGDVIVGDFMANHAYVYHGGKNGVFPEAKTVLHFQGVVELLGAWFGFSVASAGDVNHDGYADVIVSAVFDGLGIVYAGSPEGVIPDPLYILGGFVQGSVFSASTACDLNADTYADVVVGSAGTNEVFVYYGSQDGLADVPAEKFTGSCDCSACLDAPEACLEGTVGTCSGSPDEACTAKWKSLYATLFDSEGNPASGVICAPKGVAQACMGGKSGTFGIDVACAGDTNGDGFADLVVGAPENDIAYLYLGSAQGLAADESPGLVHEAIILGGNADAGLSVAAGGDLNGDGYSDVLSGGGGETLVFLGSETGPSGNPDHTVSMDETSFGNSVISLGDLNGDGFGECAVGAPGPMKAYIYEGKSLITEMVLGLEISGAESDKGFGFCIASGLGF